MNNGMKFGTLNKDSVIFEFRNEINNHLAPNVTLISSENVKVKGHSIILGRCPYFRELIKKDTTSNPHLVFHENFTGDVLEFVVKYIYIGEYSLLDVEKLEEVIKATSKEKYNIPALAKGYLLKQLDVPEGLNQSNWHLFYKNGIKLSFEEGYFNRIYAFLKDKHPEFYKSGEFKSLSYPQICKLMSSPNRPIQSNVIIEASLIWATENKVEMDKLAELSKICTNSFQFQDGVPNLENASMLDTPIPAQSEDGLVSTPNSSRPTTQRDPQCSNSRKRIRSISPQINTGSDKRLHKDSELIEIYHPPKYSWNTAKLLFFASDPLDLWSYTFQTEKLKRVAKTPMKNLKNMNLVVFKDRICSIGGKIGRKRGGKEQNLVMSFAINDLENINKTWEKEPNLLKARGSLTTLVFKNTIYLFDQYRYDSCYEKWDLGVKPEIWEKNDKDMLYFRCHFGVALLNNVIYMVGGYGGKKDEIDLKKEPLATAESFNIDDKSQALLPNMRQPRQDPTVVALKDRIYVIGGSNDHSTLRLVESYKPGDTCWVQVPSMKYPRTGACAFVIDDMIYVFGGYGMEKPLMERYSPQKNLWQIVSINLPQWAWYRSSVLLGPSN